MARSAEARSTANEGVSIDAALLHVIDTLPDAILLLDESWCITYANQTARRISRIRPENINSQSLWQLYPEILGTNLEQAYREAVATGTPRSVEAFYYAPFNIWFDTLIQPIAGGVQVRYRDVTAVHEAEAARDAATEQLQQVLEATTDAVVSLDRAWRITYMNRRAMDIIAPTGNVLGKTLWESFPYAAYAGSPFVQNYHRAMDERIPTEFDAYYPEPLNVWLHIMAQPAPEGIIVFFRDITARQRREDALRASEERYRVLAELNPQALWTADIQGRVWYANQRFLEYIGQDFLPKNGREYLQYFYEPDRPRVNDAWAHSVATGEEYAVDARIVRGSDGAVRWWHLHAMPVRDETGAIQQWLGTAVDVHDSRRAAEQLRQQYALVEGSRDFVALTDMQGTPLYGNRAALKLVGLESLAEFTRLHVRDFFFPEDQPFVTNEFFPRVLREGHGEVDIRFRHFQTGEPIWMNYHVFLLRDATGEPVAYGTVSRDVTAQKRAEAALMQSEKLAAVGRLASSIAHEINNPLESVTNLLYLAREHGGLPEQVQDFLDTADLELRRVSIIANQTLRFHKQSTKPQAIDCGDLFSTVLSIYEGRLKNSKVIVEKRKRAKKPVVCFEGEIRQVLNNMVSNAIDAMPNGGRLLVRGHQGTDWKTDRPGLILTVADTGSGIDPEARSKMFEPFFTTKGFGGTGLGLWVSAEIMKRHQGRIRIRSSQRENHRGTVVKLFLPFLTNPTEKSLHAQQ